MYTGVILSGTPGAGKSILVEKLAELYSWKKLSLGDYWKEAWKKAHPQGTMDFAVYWRQSSREENIQVNREARKAFEQGNIVCDSRYSAAYCQDLLPLLVYIDAPVRVRAGRLLGNPLYRGQSMDDIAVTLKLRENDEVLRGKEFFGKSYDYRDSKWYDLILDSSILTIEQELQNIQEQLEKVRVLPRACRNLPLA